MIPVEPTLDPGRVLRKDRTKRIREYSLLAGFLYRWIRIYERIPAPDSWIWTYFPDGEEWRAAADRHGLMTVEHMTGKLTSSHSLVPSDESNSSQYQPSANDSWNYR